MLQDIDINCIKLHWFPKTVIEEKRDMICKLILDIKNGVSIKVKIYSIKVLASS